MRNIHEYTKLNVLKYTESKIMNIHEYTELKIMNVLKYRAQIYEYSRIYRAQNDEWSQRDDAWSLVHPRTPTVKIIFPTIFRSIL